MTDHGRSPSGRATAVGGAVANQIPDLSDSDKARFWGKVERRTDRDCWPWLGATSGGGYGSFYLRGKMLQAHRVAVKLSGYATPTRMVVDHECRNRLCVNPAHLRTVDRHTNVHENSEALAHLNSLKTHCPKGHAYSGGNLVIRKNGFRRCRECERQYHKRRRAKND